MTLDIQDCKALTGAGYWIPAALREQALSGATFETTWGLRAQLVAPQTPGATAALWPRLQPEGWRVLWEGLRAAPPVSVTALETALQRVMSRLRDPQDELHKTVATLLPPHTGFQMAMLDFAFGFFEHLPIGALASMVNWEPPAAARKGFVPLPGLPGSVRFFDAAPLGWVRGLWDGALTRPIPLPRTVVGYAAGNIPGAALLITLLGQLLHPQPALLIRNSRREPFFTPLLLAALEELDPALVANVAVLIWDYDDAALQASILREADLLLLVAGDGTIARLEEDVRRAGATPRIHRHGHKISFLAVERSFLTAERLSMVATLAALDTLIWDQNGCLSPRLHFVEEGGAFTPEDYADAVTEALRPLSSRFPGGLPELRRLHSRFDKFQSLAVGGRATVHSVYDDPFLVVVDHRPYDSATLAESIADARDRTVIVRPVPDLEAIPRDYLRRLPARNLQTLSVALDSHGQDFLRFAEAVGRCGVTALRTVGRAAFPGLAHSWDGLLPCDLRTIRALGHYTTCEFDDAVAQIRETASKLGLEGC
ncbi:MAG: acyl-CoA reductase [Anaerolineae bacterium]|nr:acyl-CoA reductase [Anaerolineae bacterium]